jgi:hypothetical protein
MEAGGAGKDTGWTRQTWMRGQATPHNKRVTDGLQLIDWLALPGHLRQPPPQGELAATI